MKSLSLLIAMSIALMGCSPQSVMLMDASAASARAIGNPIKAYIYWTGVEDAEAVFFAALEDSLETCAPVESGEQRALVLATGGEKFVVGVRPTRDCAAFAVFTNMTIRDAGLVASTIDITDLRTPAIKMLYPEQLRNALTALRSRQEARPGVPILAFLAILGIE